MEPTADRSSIALIGLPASGKTTVAGLLARSLGLPLLDLDLVIAEEAGRDIPEIFALEGEEGFRKRESLALRRASELGPLVLATGGGIMLLPENRGLLKSRFRVVWLRVSPATAAGRAPGGSRPLLAGADPETRIRDLDAVRAPLYEECAEIRVDTDDRTPEAVAEAVLEQIR